MGQLLLILAVALIVGAVVFGVAVLISGGDPGLEPTEPDGRAVPLPSHRPLIEGDVSHVRFDTALRGYRMGQVDQVLRRAGYDIGYKDELINVLEAEVEALRSGRTEEAEVLRRAREAALAGPTHEELHVEVRTPADDRVVELGMVSGQRVPNVWAAPGGDPAVERVAAVGGLAAAVPPAAVPEGQRPQGNELPDDAELAQVVAPPAVEPAEHVDPAEPVDPAEHVEGQGGVEQPEATELPPEPAPEPGPDTPERPAEPTEPAPVPDPGPDETPVKPEEPAGPGEPTEVEVPDAKAKPARRGTKSRKASGKAPGESTVDDDAVSGRR